MSYWCSDVWSSCLRVLQRLQPYRVRRTHTSVLRLPAVERLLADPVPATDLRRRRSALLLTQHPNDLFLGKPTLLYHPSPGDGLSYQLRELMGSRSRRLRLSQPPAYPRLSQAASNAPR